MGLWSTVTSDIKIDSQYGDIEIYGGDLVLTKRNKEILKHTIIDRFKTSFNDYLLFPDYGANLEVFIGRGIDNKLAEDLHTAFRYALTYDNFIENSELEILPIILNNSIKMYTYINTETEDVSIVATYDKEGLSFD